MATKTVRVANIASNQVNVGVDADWHQLTATVRTHYSGRRKIGYGTTFTTDDPLSFVDALGPSVDAYSTTTVSLSYRDLLPNTTMQVLFDNVFNKNYYAVLSEANPAVPQAGRTVNLRLIYRLPQRAAASE